MGDSMSDYKPSMSKKESKVEESLRIKNYEEEMRVAYEAQTPTYYTSENGIQCIDAIAAMGHKKSFCLGNAVKYIWRAGKKDKETFVKDIEKAIHYLQMAIADAKGGD